MVEQRSPKPLVRVRFSVSLPSVVVVEPVATAIFCWFSAITPLVSSMVGVIVSLRLPTVIETLDFYSKSTHTNYITNKGGAT